MQGVVRTLLLLGGIVACHASSPATNPDAAPPTGDGSNAGHEGLEVRWSAAIPGAVTSDITVSSLLFRVASLRVIGDAGPGDDRTSADTFKVSWTQGSTPDPLEFADAPTGLYSHVAFLADGNLIDYSYEIQGMAKLNGNPTPFYIHDRSPLPVSIDTSATLDPNQITSIAIDVSLDQALQSVDWSHLDNNNGTLTLDTFDNGMNDFRGKMINSVFMTDHPDGRVDQH